MNNPLKQNGVKALIKLKIQLVYLIEIRINEQNTNGIVESLLLSWCHEVCYSDKELGRIWVLWKDN